MIDEYKLLNAINKFKDQNGETKYSDLFDKLDVTGIEIMPLINELEEKKYVVRYDLESIRITPYGVEAIKRNSPLRKIIKLFQDSTKFTFQQIIIGIIGVIGAVIAGIITAHILGQ